MTTRRFGISRSVRTTAALLAAVGLWASLGASPADAQIVRPAQDEVFYQIMPIAWRDSDNDAQRFGDFGGLTASLDYLQSLGVTAVWINPIHPTPAYHGYQHGPIDQVNTRFGTEAQWRAFVQAAHARGIKVLLDVVVYGVSQNSAYSPYFSSAFSNPSSQYDSWLAFTNTGNTQYTGSVYNTWNGATVGFIHWDLRNATVRNLVNTQTRKWLDPNNDGDLSDGVDGFRLDHAWVNYNQGPSGWGYNLTSFWTPWKQSLQAVRPDVFTVVEQADWGSAGAEFFPAHDAAFTMQVQFGLRDALNAETASRIYDTIAFQLGAMPGGTNVGTTKTYLCNIGNHDVDRLASAVGDVPGRLRAAAAVQMTQPFPPSIWMGDELGMRGTKQNYGSDANDIPMREPFKWTAVAGPPMTNYWTLNTQAFNNRLSQNNDGRSVQEQQGVSGSLLETYRTLIGVRKNSVALRRGSYTPVTAQSSRIWSCVRWHENQAVLVAVNLSGQTVNTTLNLSAFAVPGGSTLPTDLVTGTAPATITTANRGAYPVSFGPYEYRILAAGLVPPPPPPPPPADLDGRSIPADALASALRATQTTGTTLGDNVSELNQLFVRAGYDGVRVGITGNIATDGSAVILLLETGAGGQSTLNTAGLNPPPSGLAELSGTALDTGFAPNRMFFVNCFGGGIYADQIDLSASGAVKTYRGQGSVGSGSPVLTGGTNPSGLFLAIDNANTAGVTASSVASAATATTGVEMLIPYADLALPSSPSARAGRAVRLAAAIVRPTGEFGNQWLPGCPPGTGNLGLDPNMNAVTGAQFVGVTLPHPADVNGDGSRTPADIFSFLALYFAASPTADFTDDGLRSPADIFAFLNAYFGI
jgi:alpha-amylase